MKHMKGWRRGPGKNWPSSQSADANVTAATGSREYLLSFSLVRSLVLMVNS